MARSKAIDKPVCPRERLFLKSSFVFLGFVILAASAMYISTYINMNIYQVNFHYSLMLILTNSIIYCFSDSNSSA